MWTPLENLFSSIAAAFSTIVGSLLLFSGAGWLAFFLTTFNPRDEFSFVASAFAWVFMLIMASIGVVGIPFLLVHFWTLYHLLYTDDSRLQLFYIAFATHSVLFVIVECVMDFQVFWPRSSISIVVLIGCYFVVNRLTRIAE